MSEDSEWTHVVTGGPWTERHGLRCRIVPQSSWVDHYPWTARRSAKNEQVVLIEDDPFRKPHETKEWYEFNYGAEWSCSIYADDITPIDEVMAGE